MHALAGAKSPKKDTECAVLYDSLGSTPKMDASSGTEKAPSRTVRSATSGPLQLRAAWESLWGKFEKIYNAKLGGLIEVAV
jgi:hypothetical protein